MQYWATIAEDKLLRWAVGEAEGYSSGFATLDKYFRLVDGEMLTIAARPSQGKTVLGMQIVENVAKALQAEGKPGCAAVFSAEMTGWSLIHRMASALSGVSIHKMRTGNGTPDDVRQMQDALRRIRNLPIWIDDGSAPTTRIMFERLAALNQDMPVRLMMFDFLELGGDRAAKEDIRIGQIATALKDISKALQIPVIALSQLNREVESRANKMPALSDLRYSGVIEQVSDTVAMIMRPEYYIERGMAVTDIPQEDKKGVAYINIAKNRQGPVGQVKLAFVKERSMFAELAA